MRKRIGSILLVLALCLSLLPTATLAEEAQPTEPLPGEQLEQVQPVPEEPEENEEQSPQDEDVIAVQALIDALPDASELDELDEAAQESACLAASEAYEAYDTLTEAQQSTLTGADNLLAILEWATQQVAPLAEGDTHSHHPICGDANCKDPDHALSEGATWVGVDSLDKISNAGNYYLTQNIIIDKDSSTWKPANGVVLCLNGKSIQANGKFDAISVDSGVTFTLTDCKPDGTEGQITHGFDEISQRYISRGVYVNGTFNLYDGSITGNDTGKQANPGGGVAVDSSGTFNMYGGKITGNTASSGGGVLVSNNGTFAMEGGEITDNTAYGTGTNGGGGVRVLNGGSFTMKGGKISGNTTDGGGGGVAVMYGGQFAMTGGSITGNTADSGSGGGVYVYGAAAVGITEHKSSFEMSGSASIADNTAKSGGGVYVSKQGTFAMMDGTIGGQKGNEATNGGGVYVEGGKSANDTGSFTMSGGSITGNTAASGSGGVYVGGKAIFTMTDGSITGNTATTSNGGGVYVFGGTFYMFGNAGITGNKANRHGGGVYVTSSGSFEMSNGTITGNKADASGGGVFVEDNTTFTMSGGSITGNEATVSGGGVCVKGTITVSGTVHITGNCKGGTKSSGSNVYTGGSASNVYLSNGKTITIDEVGLDTGAKIGVTTETDPTDATPISIAASAKSGEENYFTSDKGYHPMLDGDKIVLHASKPHQQHPICGATCGHTGSSHDSEVWQAIGSAKELRDAKNGSYYLTSDIRLSAGTWTPANGMKLCLNGYSITGADGDAVITVNKSFTFTLTDCKRGDAVDYGKITHAGKTGHGVEVKGTFYMYGGSITGNSITGLHNGGGVYVNGGSFEMSGGSITGNKDTGSNGVGGGVYMESGSFKMSGGSITGNTATISGGGVFVDSGSFKMSSGSITGNTAKTGGGVYVYRSCTFEMSGGTISSNTATSNGGGVYVDGSFTVSGKVNITGNRKSDDENNVYLPEYKTITIGDEDLAAGAQIGVTTSKDPTEGRSIMIVGSNAKDSYEQYIKSDKGYYPMYHTGGAIYLHKNQPHFHPICGKTCEDGSSHDGVFWQPISSADDLTKASSGYYYLTDNITLTSTWTPANGVKLCLNGYSITCKQDVDAIAVDESVTFALTNCNGSGKGNGKITHQYTGQDNRVYTDDGCGVYVNDGTFNMYGGSISKNTGHNSEGGGVYVEKSGTFNMYGGSISNNFAGNTNDYTDGGGVYLNGGTFHMSGGSITGNSSGSRGGGVCAGTNSTFTLSGSASITGNWTNGSGGGVYVSSYSTFEMHDNASITGNSAKSQGGGVHVGWIGQFSMSGGSITGNNVKNNSGGGVNLASGKVTVSGSANITGNVKGGSKSSGSSVYTGGTANNVGLNVDSTITIGDSGLDGAARIGVANEPTGSGRVKIATGATGDVDYTEIFTPDVTGKGYEITKDGDELYLSAHQHKWMYALSTTTTANDTITAACENCPQAAGGTYSGGALIIKTPTDLTYDGKPKGAWGDAGEVSEGASGPFTGYTVAYQLKKSGDTWEGISGKPTDAGTYKASITLGGVTASVEYTIAKADPKASDFTFAAPTNPTYDGSTKTAEVTATGGVTGMGAVTVKYFKNGVETEPKDAGEYTVKIDVTEGTNYKATAGLTDSSWTFTIDKADYTGVTKTMEVSAPETQFDSTTYNVNKLTLPQLPEGAQYSGSVTLSDAYKGNEKYSYAVFPSGCIENWKGGTERELTFKTAGCADGYSATMTFHVTSATNYNDYDVVVTVNFVKQKQETLPGLTMRGWTYGGTVNEPQYTKPEGTFKTTTTYAKKNAGGTYENPTTYLTSTSDAGDYRVTVVCETPLAVYTGTADFTIEKKTIRAEDLKLKTGASLTKVYDGTDKHTAAVYLTLADNPNFTLGVDADKIVYNSANVNGATAATLTLSIPAGMNYKLADGLTAITVPASITRATPTVSGSGTASGTYGQKLSEVTVSGLTAMLNGNAVAGSWALTDAMSDILDTVTLNGSTIEYTAVFTPADTANLTTAEAKVAVTVAPKAGGSLGTASRTQKFTDTAEQTFDPDWTGLPAGESWSYNSDYTITGTAQVSDNSFTANGKTLTYTISGGQAGDTVAFTLKAICASGHYEPFTITLTVTLTDRDPQTFTFNETPVTKTYGDEDFTFAATDAKTSVTYSSSNTEVATVDSTSGKVHIVGAGTATITATAAQSDTYSTAKKSYTLTVEPKTLTKDDLTYTGPVTKGYDTTTNAPDGLSVSVKPASLVGGDTLSITGTLAYNSANVKDAETITFTPAAITTGNYRLAASEVLTISGASITKADPAYTAPAPATTYAPGRTLADVALTGGWSWMDSAQSVGDASETAKTFQARFTPTDTDNYNVLENIGVQLTVNKAPAPAGSEADMNVSLKYTATGEQTVDLSGRVPGATQYIAQLVNGSPDKIKAPQFSNGIMKYSLVDGTCAAGDEFVFAMQIVSTNYVDASFNLTIHLTAKDDQATLNVTGGDTVVYGQTLTFGATGGSGSGAVTYRVTNGTGEATIDPSTGVLTPVKVGTVKVTAIKAADADFNEAASAEKEITITQAASTGAPKYTAITSSGKTLADAALTVTGSTLAPNAGTLEWLDAEGNVLPNSTVVERNTAYTWRFTPDDGNYASLTGSIELYHVSSSSGGGGGSASTYSVTVGKTVNGTVSVTPKTAAKGTTVTVTVTPDKGYVLETLTALDKDGKELKLTDKGSGKYTFTMPAGSVTVKATFMDDNTMLNFFVDVKAGDFFYDAVLWAAQKGITTGTDAVHFSPNEPCTRAQIVTFLWRAAGSPVVNYAMNMSDVPEDAYYAEAVRWALSEGITSGVGDGRFDPDGTCTREQAVTLLYRASGSPAVSGGSAFGDVAADGYYANAVAWAEKNGVTGGIGGGLFGTGGDCTRGQIVTFLYRIYSK